MGIIPRSLSYISIKNKKKLRNKGLLLLLTNYNGIGYDLLEKSNYAENIKRRLSDLRIVESNGKLRLQNLDRYSRKRCFELDDMNLVMCKTIKND